MGRRIQIVLATLLLTVGVAACGVRGPLEPPPGAVNEAAPPDQSNNRPHEPTILDGLLE